MENNAGFKSRVTLKAFNTVGFERGGGKLKEVAWYICKVCFFLTALPFPNFFKLMILRLFGAKVGQRIVIKPRVNIHFPWKLQIGNDVWIGEEAFLLNFEKLLIGDNVCISQRAFLCGGNHDFRKSNMPYRNGPITLMDGSWIGASSFVGPGVVIGTDSVISAGSIVTKSIEENCVFKGNTSNICTKRWQ